MKTQTFNVICVTIRSGDDSYIQWHLQPEARTAILTPHQHKDDFGDDIVRHTVEYDGKEYPLAYKRKGLDGCAVTLAIRDDERNRILELYTDTPVLSETEVSPEMLREKAAQAITYSRR